MEHRCNQCEGMAAVFRGDDWQQAGMELHPATILHLQKTRFDALCEGCVMALEALVLEAEGESLPRRPSEWIEGRHYYVDAGRWVFTAYYHILRGYCCGNGCRHCAYGIHLTDTAHN